MSTPEPIVIGEFRADWCSVPYVSGFFGGQIAHHRKWVVTTRGAFVALAESPGEVERIVRFAERKVA